VGIMEYFQELWETISDKIVLDDIVGVDIAEGVREYLSVLWNVILVIIIFTVCYTVFKIIKESIDKR
jgi:hypothetical protein